MPALSAHDPASPPGLKALMSGYQRADENSAKVLIEIVSPPLRRYFLFQAFTRRYADDLLQDTWMRVHKARHTYRRGEPVLPWIFAIARHTALDNYRKTRRVESRETQVEKMPDWPCAEPEMAREGHDLEALLAALPERQREVIVMLKVSGMTLEEVALATSSSIGSVKQRAHRAYQRLRDILAVGARRG